jgi:hypothetical protein
MNRAPTGRGSPIEMSGRCALSVVTLRAVAASMAFSASRQHNAPMMGKLLW